MIFKANEFWIIVATEIILFVLLNNAGNHIADLTLNGNETLGTCLKKVKIKFINPLDHRLF